MKILCICPDSYGANTYMLVSGGEAYIIDPCVSLAAIERTLSAQGASLKAVILTHGHFDHTVSVDRIRDRFDIPLLMHREDAPMLTDGRIDGFFDFYQKTSYHRPADRFVEHGDVLCLGDETIRVISTPGHSPGSICLICDSENAMLSGDTLFASSVGRSDLWRGDESVLASSLASLTHLDPDIVIYPGHGPSSTLGDALKIAKYYIDF